VSGRDWAKTKCPLLKEEVPLFGKEGLGEIFMLLCDGYRHVGFITQMAASLLCISAFDKYRHVGFITAPYYKNYT